MTDGERLALGAEQHLLVRDQAGQPYRVHRHTVDVGAARTVQAGAGGVGVGRPASFRASAMSFAVRYAVPDGASALCGWCSSMTSTESKNRAACCAKRIDSTAPIAKFGAMSTAGAGLSAASPAPGPAARR